MVGKFTVEKLLGGGGGFAVSVTGFLISDQNERSEDAY
jgi:hypothetical protein